jgi:hypothetical protein
MTSIPGTSYQISGSQILSPDGREVSSEEFLQRVKAGEVSLSANSLQVISSHLGPDLTKSLELAAPPPAPAGEVLGRLTASGYGSGGGDGGGSGEGEGLDLGMLMRTLLQTGWKLREGEQAVRNSQFDQQTAEMEKAAEEAQKAASARLVAGVVSGAVSIASGAMTLGGAFKAARSLNAEKEAIKADRTLTPEQVSEQLKEATKKATSSMELMGAAASIVDGSGKITAAHYEHSAAAEHDKQSKDHDINAKKSEQQVRQLEDVERDLKEMTGKVLDTLRAVAQAEDDTNRSIRRGG